MKAHLKRLIAPKTWPIKRKGITFITRPKPSGAPMDLSIPLVVVLKELLHLAKTTKEVKRILHDQEVLVDGARVHNHDATINLFGVLSIPLLKANYRLVLTSKNKLVLTNISGKEAETKPTKIIGKTKLGKDKIQLNCIDGQNILVKDDTYKRGDTIIINLKDKKIVDHLSFDKKALVFLYKGKHVGLLANVKEFSSKEVVLTTKEGDTDTKRAYCVVVGKDKPAFTITA